MSGPVSGLSPATDRETAFEEALARGQAWLGEWQRRSVELSETYCHLVSEPRRRIRGFFSSVIRDFSAVIPGRDREVANPESRYSVWSWTPGSLAWQAPRNDDGGKGVSIAAVGAALKSTLAKITWQRALLTATEPFVLPTEWRAALVRIFAYLSAIGVMSLIAAEMVKTPIADARRVAAPKTDWIAVDNPWPAFQVSMPGIADEMRYAIRRHAEGGGRKDILSFGELGKTQRFASFEIYRAGQETASFGEAAEDIGALATEQGRVMTLNEAMPIASKFGTVRLFDLSIAPFTGYRCVGFVQGSDTRVRIGGLTCNQDTIVDRGSLSCALDRLTLVFAASDPDTAKLFAQAEARRNFCGQRDTLMYATTKHGGSDFTSSSKPKLRGRLLR